MLIIITQHGGMARLHVAYDKASNLIKYEITTFSLFQALLIFENRPSFVYLNENPWPKWKKKKEKKR